MSNQEESIKEALPQLLDALLSSAKAARLADPSYQHLFSSYKDSGIAKAVFEAEKAMKKIAMDLAQVLEREADKDIDNDLFNTLLGLPLAMSLVRGEIEQTEGNSCCADKTRFLIKTFVYDRLGITIEPIPLQPRATT